MLFPLQATTRVTQREYRQVGVTYRNEIDRPLARTVEALAAQMDVSQRRTYYIKDTHKGPVVWHVSAIPFFPQIDGLPGPVHWLIVAVCAAGGEVKYFISNASSGVPLEVLLHVGFSRWHVERCFEDEKGEIGLDHFEVRNYRSLKRHLILSAVSFLFLAETNEKLREKKSRVDGLPSQDGNRGAVGTGPHTQATPSTTDQTGSHHRLPSMAQPASAQVPS